MNIEERNRLEEFKKMGTLSQPQVVEYMTLLELEKKDLEEVKQVDEPKKGVGMFGSGLKPVEPVKVKEEPKVVESKEVGPTE